MVMPPAAEAPATPPVDLPPPSAEPAPVPAPAPAKKKPNLKRLIPVGGALAAVAIAFAVKGFLKKAEPPPPPPPPPAATAGGLTSTNDQARAADLEILKGMAPDAKKKLVPDLIQVLDKQDGMAKSRAAEALALIGPDAQPALGAMSQALMDPQARHSATSALAKLGLGLGPEDKAKAAVPYLTGVLQGADGPRLDAARALRDPGAEDAVPALLSVLKKDKDSAVRSATAYALGGIPSQAKQSIPGLVQALKDTAPEVRIQAATQLGALKAMDKKSVAALSAMAKDEHAPAREAAAKALAQIKLAEEEAAKAAALAKPVIKVKPQPVLTEKIEDACVNEIGILCNNLRADASKVLKCLKTHQDDLLTACKKEIVPPEESASADAQVQQ